MSAMLSTDHICPSGRRRIPYVALLVDPDSYFVMVQRKAGKLTFPFIECPEIPHRGRLMSECVSRIIEQMTGTRYRMVLLYTTVSETHHRHLRGLWHVMFECMAPIDPTTEEITDPASPDFEWMPISDMYKTFLRTGAWVDVRDNFAARSTVRRTDVETFTEGGLRPWEVPGWFKTIVELATSVLASKHIIVTGPFEQHQISPTAAVLRVETKSGRVYLKASHKREGSTMQYVASFAPYLVRAPIHVDVEREFMLMHDYGSTLYQRFSRTDYETIVVLHGEMQVESVHHVQKLIDIGLRQETVTSLVSRTKSMLEDPEVCKSVTKYEGFAARNGSDKADLSEYLQAVCDFLKYIYQEKPLPLALVHGDLYDENIIKPDGDKQDYVLYDWGSARIDLPFSDITDLETEISCHEEQRNVTMDPYLELWTEFGSVSELRELSSYVHKKDLLRRVLTVYEYAYKFRNMVSPRLEDETVGLLCSILKRMRETMSSIKDSEEDGTT